MKQVSVYLPKKTVEFIKKQVREESAGKATRKVLSSILRKKFVPKEIGGNMKIVTCLPEEDIKKLRLLYPDVPVGRAIAELIRQEHYRSNSLTYEAYISTSDKQKLSPDG